MSPLIEFLASLYSAKVLEIALYAAAFFNNSSNHEPRLTDTVDLVSGAPPQTVRKR
jgi:hypothetical protein